MSRDSIAQLTDRARFHGIKHVAEVRKRILLLVAYHPINVPVYHRDRSAELNVSAATLRKKLQIKLAIHSILSPGQQALVLTLWRQAAGRAATKVPSFKSLVWSWGQSATLDIGGDTWCSGCLLFLACQQCWSLGSSLGWGLNFGALICGFFWSLLWGVFSGYSGFLPSLSG